MYSSSNHGVQRVDKPMVLLYSGMIAVSLFLVLRFLIGTLSTASTDDTTNRSGEQKHASPAGARHGVNERDVSLIVADAMNFYNLLSSSQQNTLQLNYTTQLARKWSNLPCGTNCRNGLQMGTNLTTEQYQAAQQVIKDALSTATNNGYDEFHEMNLAEAYLHANGGANGYDSTLRWIAFLNAPSDTDPWMLQFGGHHYAANIAFNDGHVVGATPYFMGLEPKTFTYNGTSYDPLGDEKSALSAMLASLSASELTQAHITSSFNDCVMIPGESNGGSSSFPAIAIGKAVSELSTTQQNLVIAAIEKYTSDIDDATAQHMLQVYMSEINQTYIAYVDNGTSGNASSFFTNQGDYVRITGPHVWIEFSCQGGIVIQGQIHYHTVWRDRVHDYGVDLTGDAIDVDTGVSELTRVNATINVYPNPASEYVNLQMSEAIVDATVMVYDVNGRVLHNATGFSGSYLQVPLRNFAAGQYFVMVRNGSKCHSGKFFVN